MSLAAPELGVVLPPLGGSGLRPLRARLLGVVPRAHRAEVFEAVVVASNVVVALFSRLGTAHAVHYRSALVPVELEPLLSQ